LGHAKPAVSIRLGAPRRLFSSRQGVTGGCSGVVGVEVATNWRQARQASGVRGFSSRWTVVVTAAVRP